MDIVTDRALWALTSCGVLLRLCLPSSSSSSGEASLAVSRLQLLFLPPQLLALLADWLQGPYVYQLYRYHGFHEQQIAILFLTGYASSCVFGSFVGPLADNFGRKRMAQFFCVAYALCCLSKLSPNFWILWCGRMLGGISTSCLFSVFESWYVCEHHSQSLPTSGISTTLAISTTGNSLLAIAAGLVSDHLVAGRGLGPTAPFLLALPCLLSAFLFIACSWQENYGERCSSLVDTYKQGASIIAGSATIFKLGVVQSLTESAMFIFVFLWTPTLSDNANPAPLGRIFSCFMICIAIGSMLFRFLASASVSPERCLLLSVITFCFASLVAAMFASPPPDGSRTICFIAFLTLETSLGIYFPTIGTLRSLAIPESHRSTIINLFRVPLNLITAMTLLVVKAGLVQDRKYLFLWTSLLLFFASLFASSFSTPKSENKCDK